MLTVAVSGHADELGEGLGLGLGLGLGDALAVTHWPAALSTPGQSVLVGAGDALGAGLSGPRAVDGPSGPQPASTAEARINMSRKDTVRIGLIGFDRDGDG